MQPFDCTLYNDRCSFQALFLLLIFVIASCLCASARALTRPRSDRDVGWLAYVKRFSLWNNHFVCLSTEWFTMNELELFCSFQVPHSMRSYGDACLPRATWPVSHSMWKRREKDIQKATESTATCSVWFGFNALLYGQTSITASGY